MNRHLIVDGNGLVCKLWWASAANVPQRFLRAIGEARPTDASVCICWDSPRSWRKDVLPSYKAGRKPKPKALVEDLLLCSHLSDRTIEEMKAGLEPMFHFRQDGYEADDCIATEVRRVIAAGEFAVVMSSDKDMAQLVCPRCLWLADGKIHDEAGVVARFGVPPDKMRFLLSWTGDAVDGLPGVPGYGPKRAIPKALAGAIGNKMTYDLTILESVPEGLMGRT